MKWFCRLINLYPVLYGSDAEAVAPAWVRRHLSKCLHCQREMRLYTEMQAILREYAHLTPESPPGGWKPLQIDVAEKRRAFSPTLALAPLAAAALVLIGFVVWQREFKHVGPTEASQQVASVFTRPLEDEHAPSAKPSAPSVSSPAPTGVADNTKPAQRTQPTPMNTQQRPPAPPKEPVKMAPRTPKRILIAKHTMGDDARIAELHTAEDSSTGLEVPVQPVVAEAHPVTPNTVPEGYVIQTASPAVAGAVE